MASAPRLSAPAVYGLDLLAVLIFAILARAAHNTPEMPFGVFGVIETMWPFALGTVIGWLFCILRKHSALPVVPGGITVWLCTAVVGLLIWGINHGETPHWSFILVASSMSALLLLGWRGLAGVFARRR